MIPLIARWDPSDPKAYPNLENASDLQESYDGTIAPAASSKAAWLAQNRA